MKMAVAETECVAVRCWSCGANLSVPVDRMVRRKDTAGENTVDPHKRVCVNCWRQIGRVAVSRMKVYF